MFNNLDELYEVAGIKLGEIKDSYKCVLLGGRVAYICNFRRILTYSPNLIVLKVKGNEVNIEGVNMHVVCMQSGEMVIKGNIDKLYLSKVISSV